MKSPEQLAIRIRGGATVVTQADLRSLTTYVLLEQGDWFEPEMEFVRAFAQPGMRAIDAGANHGVYSLAFAQQLRGDGQVWALEPTTRPFRLLVDGVRATGVEATVMPIQCGLSNRARDARMSVAATSELNSLHFDHGAFEPVRLDTIDHLMRGPLRNEQIDFVKLDVEGEEANAVRGGADFFSRQSPLVQFEVKHGSTWNKGLVETLRALGYAIYRLVPGINVLVPVDVRCGMDVFQLNLFAVKPDRAIRMSARGLLSIEHHTMPDPNPHRPWQAMLRDRPYAKSFGAHWRWDTATDMCRQGRLHARALDAFASALDSDAAASRRVALLGSAAHVWTRLHGAAPEHSVYGLCLARCFAALGERGAALGVLWRTANSATGAHCRARELPFLPPLPAQDALAPVADEDSWIEAVRAEAIEVLHAHSSYFSPGGGAYLDAIMANPDVSNAMRRRHRLQAVRRSDPRAVAALSRDVAWEADVVQELRAIDPAVTARMNRIATAAH